MILKPQIKTALPIEKLLGDIAKTGFAPIKAGCRTEKLDLTVLTRVILSLAQTGCDVNFCPVQCCLGQVELPSRQVNFISYLSGAYAHFLAYMHAIQHNLHFFP